MYREKHMEKIIGVALPAALTKRYPTLCSQLWRNLDIVPLVLHHEHRTRKKEERGELATFMGWEKKPPDEQADSMARKCVRSVNKSPKSLTCRTLCLI